jgi:DNA-binding NtrC family response regulator
MTEVNPYLSRKPMYQQDPLICIVDDELSIRESVSDLLESTGLKVRAFASAHEFLTEPPTEPVACIVLDVQLPGISGLDLQQELCRGGTKVPIVFLTGYGDIPTSVRAIKAGAIEFLTKPFRDQDLLQAVNQAVERSQQMSQGAPVVSALQRPCRNTPNSRELGAFPSHLAHRWRIPSLPEESAENQFSEIVGQSAALRQLADDVALVAPSDITILILGETGTGKELIARAIHQSSRRQKGPLIRVNCTSIPKELFESEFFGHVKGAFTGAIRDRAGRFEAAAGGTLFLDEVGEIPLELQSKLLRVLQEKSYERVGEENTRSADVRIIAATNRDLQNEVAAGRFREDLYYRLSVFPLKVAPLRERKEDIPLLATYLIELSAKKLECPQPRLTPAGIATLQDYDWPGNIRELQNVIERAVISARGRALDFDLPTRHSDLTSLASPGTGAEEPEYLTEPEFRRRERENLFVVLQKTNWKIKGAGGAAQLLGVKPTTLISRLAKLGLKRPVRENVT